MAPKKVAIVTGSNKGIGFAIVKGLCEKYDGIVYMTTRDMKRGEEAVKKLNQLNLHPELHQLDIDDYGSVQKFHDFIKEKHGGFDILVNNAAIAFSNDSKVSFGIQAEETIKTNYISFVHFCDVFFPLLRQNGRVVNMSSSLGHLSNIPSAQLRAKLGSDDLTIEELNQLMNDFVEASKVGKNVELGWGKSAYNVSKVGVSALTRIQQRIADKENPNRNLFINHVHPGYVDTDMTNHKGVLSIEEGAKSSLFLCLEPYDWKGQFVWRDATVWDWCADKTPAPF